MKKDRRSCAVKDCWRWASPKTEYCLPCRAWLYRWVRMGKAERIQYRERSMLRYGRMWRLVGHSNVKARAA